MDALRGLLETVKRMFPINRVVALLTPVYAALAAYAADKLPWIANVVGGEVQLTAIIAAAGLAGVTWLYNWGKWERAEAVSAVNPLNRGEGPIIHEDDLAMETTDPDYPAEDQPPERKG